MPLPGDRLINNTLIRKCVFDASAITDSYAALPADTECNHVVVMNYTGVDADITVGGTGDAITLKDGFSIVLYGNPAAYQAKRTTGTASVNLQMVIYK